MSRRRGDGHEYGEGEIELRLNLGGLGRRLILRTLHQDVLHGWAIAQRIRVSAADAASRDTFGGRLELSHRVTDVTFRDPRADLLAAADDVRREAAALAH
jgi:hypothetical protein